MTEERFVMFVNFIIGKLKQKKQKNKNKLGFPQWWSSAKSYDKPAYKLKFHLDSKSYSLRTCHYTLVPSVVWGTGNELGDSVRTKQTNKPITLVRKTISSQKLIFHCDHNKSNYPMYNKCALLYSHTLHPTKVNFPIYITKHVPNNPRLNKLGHF